MTRQKVVLERPPGDPRKLRDFPRSTLDGEDELWRVAREGHGPWWFSSSLSGRFDLPEPEGTCYLAKDELSALLEVIGPERSEGKVCTELLSDRRLYELQVPEPHSLGDLTSRRAAGFGVTLEIHSHPHYELTQAWAKALRRAGVLGLLYFARHDPAAGNSVALFGPAGERKDWDYGPGRRLDELRLIERLWHECRIQVIDRPRKDEIPVID